MSKPSPDTLEVWKAEANAQMTRKYCIDLADAGLDDEQLSSFQDMAPTEFVDWFGEKYDLTSRDTYPLNTLLR